MSRRSRMSRCWCFFLLLVPMVPAFAGEPEWVEVRSPHFSVISDAGQKRGREVALHFEQMRAAFAALMTHGAKVTLPVPLQIVAFRNTKEMRQFVPLWKGKPTQLAGLFQGGDDRCFIMLDMSTEDPWHVVFHEYAHQLLNGNTGMQVQPWFDEGFAEFFATIEVTGKDAALGKASQSTFDILQQNKLMRVADLFQVQHNSSIYNENGDHRSLFYAQSWLVVHYIYDKQLLPKVASYFDLVLQRRSPVEQAIQQAFAMSAADFDKALQRYLNGNRFLYYPVSMPANVESSGYAVRPLPPPDTKAVLADMHLHSADYREQAIVEFEDVLKLQPENPAALRGLGYAYLMKQDYHRAGEYFRQAAEHDSSDPRVLYYSALLIQREKGSALSSDPGELAVQQKQLEKAAALDPDFAETYSLLAFTYMSQGKLDLALQTMLKAANLNPRNETFSFNLAQMYLANRKYDEALALLAQLSNGHEPMMAARAAQMLEMATNAKMAAAAGVPVEVRSGTARPGEPGLIGRKASDSDTAQATAHPPTELVRPPALVKFLKGKLTVVDCASAPAATLTVVSGAKTWKLRVQDNTQVVVIGADKFSCEWANQKVAVNYRETADAAGEVISVEVQ